MNKEYALYKGEILLDIGTLDYLSNKFKIKRKTLLFYQTPSQKRRTSEEKGRRLVRIDLESDEE